MKGRVLVDTTFFIYFFFWDEGAADDGSCFFAAAALLGLLDGVEGGGDSRGRLPLFVFLLIRGTSSSFSASSSLLSSSSLNALSRDLVTRRTVEPAFSKLRGSNSSSTPRDCVEPSTFEAGGGVGSFVVGFKGASGEDSLCGLEGEREGGSWI